jgi:hypothetical protein
MSEKRPDNVVFSEEKGYNASLLPYGTNTSAPAIVLEDVDSWKLLVKSTIFILEMMVECSYLLFHHLNGVESVLVLFN